jgi:hypothetical protein
MAETTVGTEQPVWTGTSSVEELEQRVQRLEDVVAALCDTRSMEERVAARVTEEVNKRTQAAAETPREAAGHGLSMHEPAPDFPADRLAASLGGLGLSAVPETMSLFSEVWWDIKLFWAMVRDPLYRMTWMSRLVGLLPLAYLLWSMLAGFHSGILGPFGYLLDVLLLCPFLYIAFKVWSRELRRYRAAFTQRRR